MVRNPAFKLRRASVLAIAVNLAFNPSVVLAQQGGVVVNGQVVISQPAAGVTNIRASNGAIINWPKFSIGAGELVRFVQPSASSAVLNRVVGTEASQLLGQLQANGRVFLINPNGIAIGAGARIDTNGFIASTLDIADADFLAGKLKFFAAGAAGDIVNQGLISVGPDGRIALIAPNIENSGIIQAPGGQILLAAGRRIEISNLDFAGVTFEVQAPTDAVLNLGKLLADNGAIQVFAGNLRHSGVIQANRLVQDGDGSIRLTGSNEVVLTSDSVTRADGPAGGAITIQSNGTTRVAGDISAQGSAGKGGDIRVLGERVAVESAAHLNASGASGGGQILVGGDFQGKNPEVHNARRVFVGAGARLTADATLKGDGGRIIVWSNENTRYFGRLAARGGPQGGQGGFAEVSGKQNLQFAGAAELGAPLGSSGFLLLDPLDIILSASGGVMPIAADEFSDFSGNVVTVSPSGLNAVGGNVILQANRDIYFNTAFAFTGSSLTATANGNPQLNGSIFLNRDLSSSGGAINLNAATLSGSGGIATAGGAVNVVVANGMSYSGAIASGGGNVSLTSTRGSIANANVNAGAGAVTVTGQNGVSYGSFVSTGSVRLNAPAGSLNQNTVSAGTANLEASGSINSTVKAARINATSTDSSVQLYNANGQPLRLGTISGASGAYFYSTAGIEQVAGGLVSAPYVRFSGENAAFALGSSGAPLNVATANLSLTNLAAPAHIAVAGSTLEQLSLQGELAGLAGSTVSGAANLGLFSLTAGNGVLNVEATSSGGFGSGFGLDVADAALNMTTLNMPTASVSLIAGGGGVALGAASVGSLNIVASGSISATSVTASGNISATANRCASFYTLCTLSSDISATSLTSTGGSITLTNYDNGNLAVGTLNAAGSANLNIGRAYYSYTDNNYHVTTNAVTLGSVTTGGSFSLAKPGTGDVTLSGQLSAGGSASLSSGASYYDYALRTSVRNAANLSVAGIQAGSYISLSNSGSGAITASGNLVATGSSLSVNAQDGAVIAGGVHAAGTSANLMAGNGVMNLGTVATANGAISATASGDLTFASLAAGGSNSSVSLTSSGGSVRTSQNTVGSDIAATGDVSISAGGVIGDGSFAHPLDILAGANGTVTLLAGTHVGAAGSPVTVDTNGSVRVAAGNGQFHVAVQDVAGTAKAVSAIDLSASAAGMGGAGTSNFTAQNLSVNATSDGSVITIGDVVPAAVTPFNLFRFTATGSGLTFGNVNLASSGYNQFEAFANGPLTGTGDIAAGSIRLDAGAGAVSVGNVTSSTMVGDKIDISGGDIVTGDLSGPAIVVNGNNLFLGTVATSGTHRGYPYNYVYIPRLGTYQYLLDELSLTAAGDLVTSGNVSSATSARLSAGGNLTVAEGGGSITAGTTSVCCTYYSDTAQAWAGGAGTLSVATVSGFNVDVKGGTVDSGNLSAVNNLGLAGATLTTGNLLAGGNINVYASTALNAGTLQSTGGSVSLEAATLNTDTVQAAGSLSVTGTNFNTGNLQAAGTLNLTATAGYAPGALSLTAGNLVLSAQNGNIDLTDSVVTTPTASLNASGSILGTLSNTSNLTLVTGGAFDITSTVALTAVAVTAQGDRLGGTSRISSPSAEQNFTYTADGSTLGLNYSSLVGVDLRYSEASPTVTAINLSANLATGSHLVVDGNAARLTATAVALGSGNVDLRTDGDIDLTSVVTGSGSVTAHSSAGNINVEQVTTSASAVNLTADAGSILAVGAQTYQIDNANGDVTLSAGLGSVGASASPLQINGAASLAVTGLNEILVNVAGRALTNLDITTNASGSGVIAITNSNYSEFALTREGAAGAQYLALGPVTPGTNGDFALRARDGGIKVVGDISVGNLLLDANVDNTNSTGDILIQAVDAARSIVATGNTTIKAGQDVIIAAGQGSGQSVTLDIGGTSSSNSISAGRDVRVEGNGGGAVVNQNSTFSGNSLNAGRDIRITGGSSAVAGAKAAVNASGSQIFNAGGDLILQGGSADGAVAEAVAAGAQTIQANNLALQGGAGNSAFAVLKGLNQDATQIRGSLTVQGGLGSGAYAEITAAGWQTLGTQYTYYYNPTDQVLVKGGAGDGAYASIGAAGSQSIYAAGDVSILGGSGAGAYAQIATSGSNQVIGTQSTYYYAPTANVLVEGGTGAGAYASLRSAGSQSIQAGQDITVRGGSGGGVASTACATGGAGAFAEICATGTQTIGSSANSYYTDPTANILVVAGSGGKARIAAGGDQSINAGGDITLTAGAVAGMTASIEAGAFQTVGNATNAYYGNDATGNILIQGGSASGAAAWLGAVTGQKVDAGGDITLLAGAADGAYARIATSLGTQVVGNLGSSYYFDQTNQITLTGGSGLGANAGFYSGGDQSVYSAAGINITGGTGDQAGAGMVAAGSQVVRTFGNLTLSGGSVASADAGQAAGGNLRAASAVATGSNETLIETTGSSQSIEVGGTLRLSGGGAGSFTRIKQDAVEGSQSISVGASLNIENVTANANDTGIAATGGANFQSVAVNGALVLDNQGGHSVFLQSDGAQALTAGSLDVRLGSAVDSATTVISAGDKQDIVLTGNGTAGSAFLNIFNRSSAVEAMAQVSAGGKQTVKMDYGSAGKLQVGDVTGQGATRLTAGGDQELVVGSLLVQGGAAVGSDAKIAAGANMLISAIAGAVEVRGGAQGSAEIDPPNISLVSNGDVAVQGGSSTLAHALISGFDITLAATNGNVALTGGPVAGAFANILAAGSLNIYGSGNLAIAPNAGGASATAAAPGGNNIVVGGSCIGCASGLVGTYNITVGPVLTDPVQNALANSVPRQMLSLLDGLQGIYGILKLPEDGEITVDLTRRRLPQCN